MYQQDFFVGSDFLENTEFGLRPLSRVELRGQTHGLSQLRYLEGAPSCFARRPRWGGGFHGASDAGEPGWGRGAWGCCWVFARSGLTAAKAASCYGPFLGREVDEGCRAAGAGNSPSANMPGVRSQGSACS